MTTFDTRPYVRCLPGGLHDCICPDCGPFAYAIRDYRLALRAAGAHKCRETDE